MTERKTQETNASVKDFIDAVADERRRKDCLVVTQLMHKASGKKPKMWGSSIIGCDKRFYTYANGKQGQICKIGFAPRAKSLVFYLPSFKGKEKLLAKLGKHKTSGTNGGGCLYINRLIDIDIEVLKKILQESSKN